MGRYCKSECLVIRVYRNRLLLYNAIIYMLKKLVVEPGIKVSNTCVYKLSATRSSCDYNVQVHHYMFW